MSGALFIEETQIPQRFRDIVSRQVDKFLTAPEIRKSDTIPDYKSIPSRKCVWCRIPQVTCVYVDMKASTLMSVSTYGKSAARIYTLFTGTAVRLFHEFGADHIDISGDGVFGMFDKNHPYTALCSAVTFKTFAEKEFIPRIKDKYWDKDYPFLEKIGCHIGIDRRDILVRRIGIEGYEDRLNPVWAGRLVNYAAKLAARSDTDFLLASPQFYGALKDPKATHCCECTSPSCLLWTEVDVEKKIFGFDKAKRLATQWCKIHGKDYCNYLIGLET
ncbi:MAG: hypothetical protein PHO79_04030 [Desulfoplanes sp.]|nr:hypothetical protein [Desulfoplanes sp.]